MQIGKNSVVTLNYRLSDTDGKVLEESQQAVSYLHGGYHGIFPQVEEALEGRSTGYQCQVRLNPEDAFGEYDADLVRVEPRNLFPSNVSVGMQFEGQAEDDGEDEFTLYTVTDVTDDKVIVDGNHPLADKILDFTCTVIEVRAATSEELTHGHVHGEGGHHH
jgi:FKBP-type peptidyl-prolyl cis-trans isomerase SlyD